MRYYFEEDSYTLSIEPLFPKHTGDYSLQVTISDGYSQPFVEIFKVIVEDVLTSSRTNYGKGLRDALSGGVKKKSIDIIKGTFKIRKVTKNGKMTVKFIS